MAPKAPKPTPVTCLIPLFNDWDACRLLLKELESQFHSSPYALSVTIVDDGSICPVPEWVSSESFPQLEELRVLRLRCNLGHQRALAVGLAYLAEKSVDSLFLIIDGDGEDRPSDALRLLDRLRESGGRTVVFAERTLRSEGPIFKLFYMLYRILHRTLTGKGIRFGNFSALPRELLHRLVVVPETFNHYAAAVSKAKLPYETVPTHRAKRLAGNSKMSFVPLVLHGLNALTAHGEVVLVRALIGTGMGALLGIAVFAGLQLTSGVLPAMERLLAISLAGLFTVGMSVSFTVSLFSSFLLLHNRSKTAIIPAQDYAIFVDEIIARGPRALRKKAS